MLDTSVLPTVNAALNGLSALLLAAGYLAIRRRRIEVHRALMIGASTASALFLVSYVTYHTLQLHTAFAGPAWAVRSRLDRHRRIARWTLPVWLYVSVTGVMVYLALYVIFPSA